MSEPIEANALPKMCVAVIQPENVLIGIKRGQRGYFQMYDGTIKGVAACAVADQMNWAMGVTPRQREAMFICSMMGWNYAAARPSCALHAQAALYAVEAEA